MRISTNSFYDQAVARLSSIQSSQAKLMDQISTGKRISSPADDPIASAQLLEIKNSQNVNSQYTSTRKTAENSLTAVDSIMNNMNDLLISTKSTLTQANNSTLSNSDRNAIAAQLQNNLDNLLALANTKDSNGDYMFAGQSVKTMPFPDATTAYAGDSNQRLVQVSSSRQLSLSETGDNMFKATTSGTAPDIFTTLANAITLLKTPVTNSTTAATLAAGLSATGATLDSSLDTVLTARASAGARLNELDSLDVAGSALDVQYQSSISDLEDLDYAKALSDQSKLSTILDAAQKSFTKTAGLSLFSLM